MAYDRVSSLPLECGTRVLCVSVLKSLKQNASIFSELARSRGEFDAR
jgi:hypothetical protein